MSSRHKLRFVAPGKNSRSGGRGCFSFRHSRLLRLVVLVLTLLTLVGTLPVPAMPILDRRIIIVAGDAHFPPYEFIEENSGVYRGFNVDVMKAVALQTGYEIEFRPMAWGEVLEALDEGLVDVVQGMKYDDERAQKYDFSDEYIMNSLGIFVAKDTHAISDLEGLQGHRVAVEYGDIAYQRLKNDHRVQLFTARNQEQALELLLAGKVTAVVGNRLTGQYILQKNHVVDQVKIMGPPLESQRYGVAVRKGDAELLAVFNQGLRAIKANGTYDKIYGKWFGEIIEYPAHYYKRNLTVALTVLGILALLVVIFLRLNALLKQEVQKRTGELEAVNRELLDRNQYIRNENQYKEKLLNSGYSGIITLNRQGRVAFANNYARRYLAAETAVDGDSDFDNAAFLRGIIVPGGLAGGDAAGTVVTGEMMFAGAALEYTYRRLDESDSDGGWILHFRDVTAERHLQEQLNKKAKLESLGNLVSCIAHEIRTPLTSIKTFVELIPEKFDNPAFREKISRYVPAEIERLNAIVSDLLHYSRPRRPLPESVGLKDLLDEILPGFAPESVNGTVRLIVAVAADIKVLADRRQLQQVLLNVIGNGVQAAKDSGLVDGFVKIQASYLAGDIVIAITDSGGGIPSALLDKIFDPFFTTKADGTGLGLFVSYQMVKENGGEITAVGREQEGAGVYIRLPVWPAPGEGEACNTNC